MPEILIFIIIVIVVGVVVYYIGARLPVPWSYLLYAVFALMVLAWFGRVLHLW